MKVVAAINGLLTSEVAAFYALRYAAWRGFSLILLHVVNDEDDKSDVVQSMEVIEAVAAADQVTCARVWLAGNPVQAIRCYLAEQRVDTLFCSTSRQPKFWKVTLRDGLIRQPLAADLAVVKVVRLDAAQTVRNLVLPIIGARLSVQKFAFVAGLAQAYGASVEVYSLTLVSPQRQAKLDIPLTRALLRRINDHLSHYLKLARGMGLSLHIKHAAARNEIDQLLHHLARSDCQLMVIGGRRPRNLANVFWGRSIERLFRETTINTIALYGRDDG